MTNVAENLILFTATISMACGVYQDIKDRRFPNSMIYTLIFLGFLYSFYKHQVPEAFLGFIAMNVIGIVFHKYHLIAPGDMKYLSTIFLFISVRDWKTCVLYIVMACIFSLIHSAIFYRKKYNGDTKKIKEQLESEVTSLSYLCKFRINTFKTVSRSNFETKEDMLANSMPYTIPLFLAFVVSFVIPQIIQVCV